MFLLEDYFSIQIFFIIFRETLETAIIISVLLSYINQRDHNAGKNIGKPNPESSKLKLQVWIGAISGLVICFIIGVIFILSFYLIGKDFWSYTERIWEGVFSLLSSIIITIMGIGLLRINKVMKVKWWIKLGDAYTKDPMTRDEDNSLEENYGTAASGEMVASDVEQTTSKGKEKFSKKYFLAILPLVTTLREGLEAVVFVGGIGMSLPVSSIPISILAGILFGAIIGYTLYKGGNKLSLQFFLIFLTCFLYIVSAGLFSRGVWFLELEQYVRLCGGLDVTETGSGPGSYDISKSVWHVNCCNGLKDGWWMVFNAIFGWTNSATYGSVTAYCAYWIIVIIWLNMRLYEEREGILPLIPIKWQLKRITKKVKLYEKRYEQYQNALPNGATSRDPNSLDIGVRDAESQILLD